jgi:hypothetical protein
LWIGVAVGLSDLGLRQGLEAGMNPGGLLGVRWEECQGGGPELGGLAKEATIFQSACILGQLIEASTVDKGLALRADLGLKGQIGAALLAILMDELGNGRHRVSKSDFTAPDTSTIPRRPHLASGQPAGS